MVSVEKYILHVSPQTTCHHKPLKLPQSELVACLTPFEISEAKMFFRSFDADSDGKITLREAEKAYERWFASLWSKVLK